MNSPHTASYTLLDFGAGRKLERFGPYLLDRPSPPAEGFCRMLSDKEWAKADAVFHRRDGLRGAWSFREKIAAWQVSFQNFSLELKPTDVGHLGVFPEQAENWAWLAACAEECLRTRGMLRVLNLFAYTGASTLAVARSPSAEITHVDAAKNVVSWARQNAEISGLADVPIRWIAEDAVKFTRRELRRGKTYDAVILDPPSYGHGTGAEVWKIEKDLPILMEQCAELTRKNPAFFLITAHSPDFPASRLAEILKTFFPHAGRIHRGGMSLRTADGRELPSGEMARLYSL